MPSREELEILSEYGYYQALALLKVISEVGCDEELKIEINQFLETYGERR